MTTSAFDARRRPQPDDVEVQVLHRKFEQDGDPEASERLIARYKGIAISIARRLTKRPQELQDVEQVAMFALYNALCRFDTQRNVSFSSFAWKTVEGEVKRYFRDQGKTIHVPRPLQEKAARVSSAVDELEQQQQRSPTVGEIAAFSGLTDEDVIEALEMQRTLVPMSVDTPYGDDSSMTPYDRLGEEDRSYEQCDDRAELNRAMSYLPERERHIFLLHALRDMSQQEIATTVGISQMHVSRLLRRSKDQLSGILKAGA